jgi:Flp pilus assembly protein TadG
MTAVEFAIIAPIFFFLMFVIAETALIFIAEQVMDNAVFETARLIRTGQAQTGTWDPEGGTEPMTIEDFREAVCARVSVFVTCEDLYLDVTSYDNFGALAEGAQTQPVDEEGEFGDAPAFQLGSANDVVIVRAYYQWPTNNIFGSLSLANMANGKRLIGSFAAFCNEPYQTTVAGCG